jgi:hypothetical protein
MAGRGVGSAGLVIVARVAIALAVLPAALTWTGSRAAALPIDPDWAPPATVYIPETGHTIDRLFLDLWRTGGGEFAYGNPITREIEAEDGHVVQYYEYARFEYWPEGNADGEIVALGPIGAELGPPAVVRRRFQGRGEGRAAEAAAAEARAWTRRTEREANRFAREHPDYRFVPEAGHGVWGGFRAFWEGTGEAAYLGNPVTEEYVVGRTSYQVFERGKLRWRPGEEVAMEPVGAMLAERYDLPTRPERQGDVPAYDEALFVPPVALPDPNAPPAAAPGGGRSIVVSLGQQALWAFDGGKVVRTSYVSTGTTKFRTPPGQFYVNTKIDSQTMEGVLGGEYYNVPDVPYVMYFTDRGHAIHGTYWHENFGNPMSHGCVNLPMDVAEWIYGWAPVGLPVLIVE